MVKLTVTQPETAIEARTSASQCQFEPASVVVSDCEGAMGDCLGGAINCRCREYVEMDADARWCECGHDRAEHQSALAADEAAEKSEAAEEDFAPFPWAQIRKRPATTIISHSEAAERRRLESEADALAASSPLVAALLGLKS